jgi:glycosyltransferase involved in cell wall biosynthesis
MLTVIIPTRESERTLVQTLSPLVAGATAGLIAQVIVADAGSGDATAEVAEIAGCVFLRGEGPVGARLNEAAALARTPWLMFLRPGTVPNAGWLEAVDAFIQGSGDAAAFALPDSGGLLQRLLRSRVQPDQGLLIRKRAYDTAGGHAVSEDAETVLLRRLGRIALLPATIRVPAR